MTTPYFVIVYVFLVVARAVAGLVATGAALSACGVDTELFHD